VNIKKAVPYLTVLGVMATGVWGLEARFTTNSRHEALAAEVSLMELQRQRREVQARVWFLEDQVSFYPNNDEIKKKLRQARADLEDLKDQIKAMKGVKK
jgi:hypothetical protein